MNTAARLGLYGLGLVAVFGLAAATSSALVPDDIAADRRAAQGAQASQQEQSTQKEQSMPQHSTSEEHGSSGHGAAGDEQTGHAGHGAAPSGHLSGLALTEGGYRLDTVAAPASVGAQGTLSFRILDDHGEPVTDYELEHDKELHLIVVRSDGAHFRHVHPERDATGTWSLDWAWDAAGTYRVYTDFTAARAEGVTLSRTVQVAGDFVPVDPQPTRTAQAGGYELELSGELTAGTASELTVTVAKDGEPVTTLEPYLGAFGHLVALRQGDLGYAHVHPEGDAPKPGETAGPDVSFAASVPTAGRYLLYFDFQIDGTVHSVPFVVDATH